MNSTSFTGIAVKHIALIAVLLAPPLAVLAQSAAPLVRPSNAKVLSAADHDLFTRAFAAGAKSDWGTAMTLGDQGKDTVARQLLQWRYALDRNGGAKFTDIDAVMKIAATWPLKATLEARAEAAITPDMSPGQIVQWFAARTPSSSIGRIRLGEALVASGQPEKGGPMIARGWAEGSFDELTERQILSQDAAYLTPQSDLQRLDNLLWRDETAAARRQMSRVDAKTAAIARARIMLDGGTKAAKAALDAVRDSDDPGLLYDWSRALRIEHKDDEAHRLLMRIVPTILARDRTARWWAEVNVQARDMLTDDHDPAGALAMLNRAALPAGEQYVDQQFLAGFIALRFVKDPAGALPYFQRLTAAVARPISKSRGEYWQGRTYEAMGNMAGAVSHYRLAAAYPEAFYGQLALARIDPQPVLHLNQSAVVAAEKSEIENDALMPQIRVLADLGQASDLRQFVQADAAAYPSPRHLKAMMQTVNDWGFPEIAVRLAKEASYAGVTFLDFTHPVIALPNYKAPGDPPDPAVVLGLIRQETEFDPYAVSTSGARGLMQMMPAAARKAAKTGLPYRPNALLSDTEYNMQLGMIEYAGHIGSWNQSLVLAAAGYNAGDGNARRWVAALGDPRNGAVDPLDFIEQIPFSETRNYVQRVLENTEVYRNRLAGKDLPLQIMSDLYAPQAPVTVVVSAPTAAQPKAN